MCLVSIIIVVGVFVGVFSSFLVFSSFIPEISLITVAISSDFINVICHNHP